MLLNVYIITRSLTLVHNLTTHFTLVHNLTTHFTLVYNITRSLTKVYSITTLPTIIINSYFCLHVADPDVEIVEAGPPVLPSGGQPLVSQSGAVPVGGPYPVAMSAGIWAPVGPEDVTSPGSLTAEPPTDDAYREICEPPEALQTNAGFLVCPVPTCKKVFKQAHYYSAHYFTTHAIKTSVYYCPVCTFTSYNRSTFEAHMATHRTSNRSADHCKMNVSGYTHLGRCRKCKAQFHVALTHRCQKSAGAQGQKGSATMSSPPQAAIPGQPPVPVSLIQIPVSVVQGANAVQQGNITYINAAPATTQANPSYHTLPYQHYQPM